MFSFMIITLKLVFTGSVLLIEEHLHLPPNSGGFESAQDGRDPSRSGGFKPHGKKSPHAARLGQLSEDWVLGSLV